MEVSIIPYKRVILVTAHDTNYVTADWWNAAAPTVYTPTAMSIAANTITLASNGLANGDIIQFVDLGTATGIDTLKEYFVVGVSGNDFQVALTKGGSAVDITGANTTPPTYKIKRKMQTGRVAGPIVVTTAGSYNVLPVGHNDTNTTTEADMGAVLLYLPAGGVSPFPVKKVFSTGSVSTSGIKMLLP